MTRATAPVTRRPAPAPADPKARAAPPLPLLLLGLTLALLALMLVAVGVGSVSVPPDETWRVVLAQLTGGTGTDPVHTQIIWDFRVPRVLLAALAGTGLAVAGVVLQAVVANPIADPYVLGVSSGAALGAVLALSFLPLTIGWIGVSSAAFLGAVLSAGLAFLLGRRAGRLAPTRLVLSGVAIGYLFLAATSYLQLRATPGELRSVMFWMLGSVSGASWQQLPVAATVILTTTAALVLLARRLNTLLMGDESATALGVDVHRLRAVLLVLAALLTGTVIAVAGGIGFVGLVVPHLVRLSCGGDHRRLLPLAAVTGAVYLVAVDLLSRTVDRPNELPIGIFTALFGAPFFLWLLRRNTSLDAA
ncbi:iron ABC transporter permease [Streptomyces chumphonensis]|uniref:Iron ABC transporter permease n=2 Tax=Streptomyces chumphonensis TaxID=1214925 RepID=A0A927F1Q9_9ACTN|nr:iron ABC transporter permease [Streptomyces chumphonensis]